MKKIIYFIVLLTSTVFYAQSDIKVDIKKSEILKEKSKHTKIEFSDSDDNGGIITVKSINTAFLSTKEYIIDHFDANLKLIKSVTIPNEKRSKILNAFVKNGNIYLIQRQMNRKEKSLTFYVHTASVNSLKFSKKELLVLDKDKVKKYFAVAVGLLYFDNGINQSDGDHMGKITISKNKKYILLSLDIKKKEKETHLFIVFNDAFKKVYQTYFERDIKDKYFDFEDVDISDYDGTIFLLGKAYENKSRKSKKKGKTNYHYEVYKLSKDGKQQLNIKEPEKFIGSLYALHNKGQIALVGFYSDKDDYRYKGVCRYDLSNDLKIINKSFQPFSTQFFEDKYKKGAKVKKKHKELKHLAIKSIFLDNEGNVVINAEEQYITRYYSQSQHGGHWVTVYNFDDIITVKLDKNGKLIWARNINKWQTGFVNSSFTAIFVNNKNYIFLNASDKIKKLSNNRISFRQTSGKKSNLYVIRIDEKGDFTYKKLIDDKESKVWYKVADGIVNTKEKSVIFQGVKKKYQRILKVTIKE